MTILEFTVIAFNRFIPESPRWLLTKKQEKECATVLQKV